jgi:hypothetical protein
MTRIFFAAGGMNEDYYFITFIAKDKRENRCMLLGLNFSS